MVLGEGIREVHYINTKEHYISVKVNASELHISPGINFTNMMLVEESKLQKHFIYIMYNKNGKIKDRMILYQIQVVILSQRGKIMETVEMFLFHKVSGT